MSYRDVLHYMASQTEVVELVNDYGGRVAICPAWNGRVMTSSCDGLEGAAMGFVHIEGMERLAADARSGAESVAHGLRFLGGEDQFDLAPVGGRFGIDAAPRTDERAAPLLWGEGAFTPQEIRKTVPEADVVLQRRAAFFNRAGTPFTVDLVRQMRLLQRDDLETTFGTALASALDQPDSSFVAFETVSSLVNRGEPMVPRGGLITPRVVGMFGTGDRTAAILPFRPVCEVRHGITPHYFGLAPHRRLWTFDHCVALRADGEHRVQVGASYLCAMPLAGAIDFREGVLTLVAWSLPPLASEPCYLANAACCADHPHETASPPVAESDGDDVNGDVARVYVSGGMLRSETISHPRFYEIDTAAPAHALPHGGSILHRRQTVHLATDSETLRDLAAQFLACDYDTVLAKLLD